MHKVLQQVHLVLAEVQVVSAEVAEAVLGTLGVITTEAEALAEDIQEETVDIVCMEEVAELHILMYQEQMYPVAVELTLEMDILL